MSRVTYDVECLYRGGRGEPDMWKTWMSDYPEDTAKNILKQAEQLIGDKNSVFKAARLVKVTREVI